MLAFGPLNQLQPLEAKPCPHPIIFDFVQGSDSQIPRKHVAPGKKEEDPFSKNELMLLILIFPENIYRVVLLEVGKGHRPLGIPRLEPYFTLILFLPSTLLVLLVSFG